MFYLIELVSETEEARAHEITKGLSDKVYIEILTSSYKDVSLYLSKYISEEPGIFKIEIRFKNEFFEYKNILVTNKSFKKSLKEIDVIHSFASNDLSEIEVVFIKKSTFIINKARLSLVILFFIMIAMLFFLRSYIRTYFGIPIEELSNAFKYYSSKEFQQSQEDFIFKSSLDSDELIKLKDALQFVKVSSINRLKMNEILKIRVKSAVQSKNVFIASMTHDFKTPLVSIAGINKELSNRIDTNDKVAKRLIRAMNYVIFDMESIVSNVLDLSKIEAGESLAVEEEHANLCSVINCVISSYSFFAEERGVYFLINIDKAINNVKIDARKYKQILRNIVSNAIKYSRDTPVSISVYFVDKSIRTEVSDKGPGVSNNVINTMFKPFERDKNDLTEGTGIGLSLSQKVLNQIGKTITFTNNKKAGATFRFDFPVTYAKSALKKLPSKAERSVVLLDLHSKELKEHVACLCINCFGFLVYDVNDYKNESNNPIAVISSGYFKILSNGTMRLTERGLFNKSLNINHWKERGVRIAHVFENSGFNPDMASVFGFSDSLMLSEIQSFLVCESSYEKESNVRFNKYLFKELSILISEDNKIYAELLIKNLLRVGFVSIQHVENGEDAVNKVKKNHIDVIFMDHMMPIMNGIEASKIIKSISPDTLILGFTAAKNEIKIESEKYMDKVYIKDLSALNEPLSYINNHFKDDSQGSLFL